MTVMHSRVTDYFALVDSDDKRRTIRVFASDAEVVDDGRTYSGTDAILDWLTGAASEYATTASELSSTITMNTASVLVRLEGNFPGGLIDLRHDFELDPEGNLTRLAIEVSSQGVPAQHADRKES